MEMAESATGLTNLKSIVVFAFIVESKSTLNISNATNVSKNTKRISNSPLKSRDRGHPFLRDYILIFSRIASMIETMVETIAQIT